MDGKKFFFFSLIVLSIVMGSNWFKNKPKVPPKKIKRPAVQVPINPEDLVNASDTSAASASSATAPDTPPLPVEAVETVIVEKPPTVASEPEIASNSLFAESNDPIILEWQNDFRNPFEPSPFAELLAVAGKASTPEGETKIAVKKKPTQLLSAPFTGTLETEEELVAIIGRDLFKTGGEFEGKTIKKIEKPLVTLEDENALYVLPKTGVVVNLASDGTYSFVDNYVKLKAQ